VRKQATAEQLIDGINPVVDKYDRRILFELTKRRMDEDDFKSDTSFEEDLIGVNGGDKGQELERSLLSDGENNLNIFSNRMKMSIRPPTG
jgi:hypothetical protein